MSKPGDVVWADGKSWQRDDNNFGKPEWWYSPISKAERQNTLKNLKECSDFRWLVKNGDVVPNYDDAVQDYEPIVTSLHEEIEALEKATSDTQGALYQSGVADGRGMERQALQFEVDEMTSARDQLLVSLSEKMALLHSAKKNNQELRNQIEALDDLTSHLSSEIQLAEEALGDMPVLRIDEPEPGLWQKVKKLREAWGIVAEENISNIKRANAAIKARKQFQDDYDKVSKENQALYKELVEAEQKLQVHQTSTSYVKGYGDGAHAEAAAIVKWLRDYCEKYPGHHNYRVTRNIANDIERGEHLAGNDE